MGYTSIETTLSMAAEADTMDEALQVAIGMLDSHNFKPGTYLFEIASAITEDEAGDTVFCFTVFVQGDLDE